MSVLKKSALALLMVSAALLLFSRQEVLKEKVSVTMKLLPLYALDARGNPVFDLKPNEVELFVNGRQVEFSLFERMAVTSREEKGEALAPAHVQKAVPSGKVVFLIIDTVFNSPFGLKRSKALCQDIVRSFPPAQNDVFMLLVNYPDKGLRYIAGPERNADKMVQAIERLKLVSANQWFKNILPKKNGPGLDVESQTGRQETDLASEQQFRWLHELSKEAEIKNYRERVLPQFSAGLSPIRYTLRPITRAKMAYLFSEGVGQGIFSMKAAAGGGAAADESGPPRTGLEQRDASAITAAALSGAELNRNESDSGLPADFSSELLSHFKSVADAFIEGGCLLHTVNSGRQVGLNDPASGELALRYLARESGGEYFATENTEKLAKRLGNSASAFYELAFAPQEELGEVMNLEVRCKRQGVTLKTLPRVGRDRPYAQMEKNEKKAFALNLALNPGSFIAWKVEEAKFKILNRSEASEQRQMDIEVAVPAELQSLPADIYLVRVDLANRQSDVQLRSEILPGTLFLQIKGKKGERLFFVIIPGKGDTAVFNEIR